MSRTDIFLKRTFDLVLSSLGLLVAAPLIGLCWVVAAIDVRGNGFFIQRRVGRHGRIIRVCKIKTMRTCPYSEVGTRSPIASLNAASVTRSGVVFRKYKLDELPQLFHVLTGTMSLVGPRPDVPGYADRLVGSDRMVLLLRPGLTGPASIKYKDEERLLAAAADPVSYNDQIIWPDKVRINRHYLTHYSLLGDLRYLVQTITG